MALDFPPGFPEHDRLPVIAAEALARSTMIAGLADTSWGQVRPGGRYVGDVIRTRELVVAYLNAVVAAFAREACLAVRASRYRAVLLDASVEAFVTLAQHHVWTLYHPQIHKTWPELYRFQTETRLTVMASPWHAEYLAEVPRVIAALNSPPIVTNVEEDLAKRRADARHAVVDPLLNKKGLTPSRWADNAGVDPSVAYGYLKGQSSPRPDNRNALAGALGLKGPDLPE